MGDGIVRARQLFVLYWVNHGVGTEVTPRVAGWPGQAMSFSGMQARPVAAAVYPPDYAALDDAAVMARVAAGDDAAFDHLVRKFHQGLIGFLYRSTGSQATAEELAQEVFLRVYRARASYAAEAKFTTWLYRIATNLAVNHARDTRAERQGAVSLDQRDLDDGPPLEIADQRMNAEQALVKQARLDAIRARVLALPERQRLAVLMHKYQEMDYRQIGAILKLSESATKSLLFRAYETLREQLKDLV